MEETSLQALLRQRMQLRVGPEMAAYLLRQLQTLGHQDGATVPVIAADARTGVPLRRELPLRDLRALADAAQAQQEKSA